jgi:glycosyltransferase involved in cell wall biosynthesis
MRIAQVTTADMAIQYLLLNQIRAFEKAGYQVTAVCAPGPGVDSLRKQGLQVHTVAMERELSPLRDLQTLARLIRYFRSQRFDAVITHTPKAGLLGPLAARLAGSPLVIHTVHGFLFHDRMPLLRRWAGMAAEIFTALFANHLFFQSSEDVEAAKKLHLKSSERLCHIGNGIDLSRFTSTTAEQERRDSRKRLGIPAEAFVVGTVGRLVWEKGLREFFGAAHQLSRQYPNMIFLLIGPIEPNQKDGLTQEEIDRLNDLPYLRILGHRDDVHVLYQVMDLFVLASHREGIPRALMEASASSIPVIASDIRGCREVVVHGQTGLLFTVRDVTRLASAIVELYRDPNRRVRMGQAGRNHIVTNFDEKAVAVKVLNKIEKLLVSDSADSFGRKKRWSMRRAA